MGGWGETLVVSLQSPVVSKSLMADGRWLMAATSQVKLGFPARLNERGWELSVGIDAPSARPSKARLPTAAGLAPGCPDEGVWAHAGIAKLQTRKFSPSAKANDHQLSAIC
jgi:hypothetical protein